VLAVASTRAEAPSPSHHLVWKRAEVDGRPALYGVAGEGVPVLFLHGWGLGQKAYKRSLKRVVEMGVQVIAPALPGFGGTSDLPGDEFNLAGYAAWVDKFLDAIQISEPVFLLGHSFGGGVAIQTAHDHPERVRFLVLINSIGGSAWSNNGGVVKTMAERPLWDWGIHFPRDILPLRQITRVVPRLLEDVVGNAMRNPAAFVRVANLARSADLTSELEELKRRKLPVVVLWGNQDTIIPKASFEALCEAIGAPGEIIPGNHSWLLADPDAFGEVLTNVIKVADVARSYEAENKRKPKNPPRELPSIERARPADERSA
jgi:pimeloyl-ACP methyl ester carboxylesterase